MTKKPLFVRSIVQKDAHTFTIEWHDGLVRHYRLNQLQMLCPCAACVDENSGKRILDTTTIKSDVRAIHIRNVGRYALKIQFTSGCSNGIYDFDFLYHFQ